MKPTKEECLRWVNESESRAHCYAACAAHYRNLSGGAIEAADWSNWADSAKREARDLRCYAKKL